ncbi:hypothetical protein DFP72DRAFT_871936 [Ephemerocybe angulata]|uniref:F-box domain-containing protein n=1 Tax=Ephemerocybe angulata TaxID=980116 RepID=A0A8H6MGZ8_9AGAR|nr:hypothetical protein DFP72DRAFT_871936 [Tulosesus angulatus]
MGPPFAQFTGTNHIPTEEELAEIKKLLLPDDSRLAAIEIELEDLAQTVEKLKKEKSAILQKTRHLRALSSLTRRLPTPIMEAIFIYSIPVDPISPISVGDPPLVFLRVCRAWRNMALEMPRLWSSFRVSVPLQLIEEENPTKVASFQSELSRWLDRSGSVPLEVEIRQPQFPEAAVVATVLPQACSLVAENSHRWESLDFEHYSATWQVFEDIDVDSLAALKSLRIMAGALWSTGWPGYKTYSGTILFLYNLLKAPNLARLQIWHDGRTIPKLSELPVHFGKLTSLTLGCHELSSPSYSAELCIEFHEPMYIFILEMLQQCHSLQECKLSVLLHVGDSHWQSDQSSDGSTLDMSRTVSVPSLKSLYLEGSSTQMEMVIQNIDTPVLHELHYYPHYKMSRHSYWPIVNFLRIHGQQIQTLHIDLPALSDSDFFECMHSCPNLKQLQLGPTAQMLRDSAPESPPLYIPLYRRTTDPTPAFIFTDEHLKALTPNEDPVDGSKCLCPHIEILRSHVKSRVSPTSVLAFLNAKARSQKPGLKELTIRQLPTDFPYVNVHMHAGKPIHEDLEKFVEAGVNLIFDTPGCFVPTPFHGATLPKIGYETDFGSGYM